MFVNLDQSSCHSWNYSRASKKMTSKNPIVNFLDHGNEWAYLVTTHTYVRVEVYHLLGSKKMFYQAVTLCQESEIYIFDFWYVHTYCIVYAAYIYWSWMEQHATLIESYGNTKSISSSIKTFSTAWINREWATTIVRQSPSITSWGNVRWNEHKDLF